MTLNNDYVVPIIILLIIVSCVLYFKRMAVVTEPFEGLNLDVENRDIQINGNLFIGYNVATDGTAATDVAAAADEDIEIINRIKHSNPSKFNHLNTKSNSIVIKKKNEYAAHKFCFYNRKKKLNVCLDTETLNKFDYTKRNIPRFLKRDKHVYYNEDDNVVKHDRLCFGNNREDCIFEKDLDKINGKMAVNLKLKSHSVKEDIRPYYVEYADKTKGFNNLVEKPFYMTEKDKKVFVDNLIVKQRIPGVDPKIEILHQGQWTGCRRGGCEILSKGEYSDDPWLEVDDDYCWSNAYYDELCTRTINTGCYTPDVTRVQEDTNVNKEYSKHYYFNPVSADVDSYSHVHSHFDE
jgi:hypothetical protein